MSDGTPKTNSDNAEDKTPTAREWRGAETKTLAKLLELEEKYSEMMRDFREGQNKASLSELDRMLNCAKKILEKLELPFRVVLLSSGDMGFSSEKTFDLEVWIPSENSFREISSCSSCGVFQSRRMGAKYKSENSNEFVGTLNGSGLAVGRLMIALLENNQNEDGSISIPNVLKKYMNNLDKI